MGDDGNEQHATLGACTKWLRVYECYREQDGAMTLLVHRNTQSFVCRGMQIHTNDGVATVQRILPATNVRDLYRIEIDIPIEPGTWPVELPT